MGEDDARLLDRAMKATGISVTLADAQAPDLPLLWVNRGFSATTGYALADVVGRNCRFLQGADTEPEAVRRLRTAILDNEDTSVTLLNYRRDGTPFWNEVSISPVLDDGGRVTHYVGVQTDVTERVKAEQRLALLAEVTEALAATLDLDDSLDRLTRLVVPRLADWVVLNLGDEQGRLTQRAIVRHRDGREDLLKRYTELVPSGVPTDSPLHQVLAGAAPSIIPAFTPRPPEALSPAEVEIREISLELGATSLMFVPLVARRRVLGTMMLVHGPSGRVFDDADLKLTADLGRRAGLALDNARLYTREHQTALTLQESLLPALPALPGLHLAARYVPAGQESQVGGDWWDVFALPDGATGLAVGDVMGHDVAAAAAMGQLRSVLRTCAWAGEPPATVLDRMDQLVQSFEMAQLATCIYARLQPDPSGSEGCTGRRLRWANAGHLPPVLLPHTGPARLLRDVLDVPLGVPALGARGESETCLEPGDTLLLYTDGLVETRRGDIECDVERLRERVSGHRAPDGPQVLVDLLAGGLTDLPDDVALLAIQLT